MDPTDPTALPLRRLTRADLAACSGLAESRGWGREEHKWRLLLTAGQGYGVDAPDRPGELIGAFVLTPYGPCPATPEPWRRWVCVSMVLVAERCAGRGLGRRMMQHALGEADGAGCFLTATEAGRPLYASLGFRPVGSLTTLTGRFHATGAVEGAAGPSVRPAVRRAAPGDMARVHALDAPAFGADRTGLLDRLPSFADRVVVAEDARGHLTGFAAAWPNSGTTVVGPVVAVDLSTAQALVTDLGRHAADGIRFDADARHPRLTAWLRDRGLTGTSSTTLMVHGAPDIPGDPALRYAPYSVALG